MSFIVGFRDAGVEIRRIPLHWPLAYTTVQAVNTWCSVATDINLHVLKRCASPKRLRPVAQIPVLLKRLSLKWFVAQTSAHLCSAARRGGNCRRREASATSRMCDAAEHRIHATYLVNETMTFVHSILYNVWTSVRKQVGLSKLFSLTFIGETEL